MTLLPPDNPASIDEEELIIPSLGDKDAAALGFPPSAGRTPTQSGRHARMFVIALIILGAALGATARYLLAQWVAERFGTSFPYATLLINLSGSFLLGFVYAALLRANPSITPYARAFLGVGLLGGYTTFSSFSYETSQLLLEGNLVGGMLNPLVSVVGGVLLCMLGILLANVMIGK